jgi:hypothetical protein
MHCSVPKNIGSKRSPGRRLNIFTVLVVTNINLSLVRRNPGGRDEWLWKFLDVWRQNSGEREWKEGYRGVRVYNKESTEPTTRESLDSSHLSRDRNQTYPVSVVKRAWHERI